MTIQEQIDGLRDSARYYEGTDSTLLPLLINSAASLERLQVENEEAKRHILELLAWSASVSGKQVSSGLPQVGTIFTNAREFLSK